MQKGKAQDKYDLNRSGNLIMINMNRGNISSSVDRYHKGAFRYRLESPVIFSKSSSYGVCARIIIVSSKDIEKKKNLHT